MLVCKKGKLGCQLSFSTPTLPCKKNLKWILKDGTDSPLSPGFLEPRMFSQDTAASNVASPSPEGYAFPQKIQKMKSQISLFVKNLYLYQVFVDKKMEISVQNHLVNHCRLTPPSGLCSKEYSNCIFLKALLTFFRR